MSLESKLAAIREASSQRIPATTRNVMAAANETLRASGIIGKAIKPGDKLPPFSLPNQHGETVDSGRVLAEGAVVLTVFRGHW